MASSLKNLSDHDPATIPDGSSMKVGIAVSEWNEEITAALLEGAVTTLQKHGVSRENIQADIWVALSCSGVRVATSEPDLYTL